MRAHTLTAPTVIPPSGRGFPLSGIPDGRIRDPGGRLR